MRSSTVFSIFFVFAVAAFLTASQYEPKEEEIIVQSNSIELPGLPDTGTKTASTSLPKKVFQGEITAPVAPISSTTPRSSGSVTSSQVRAIYLTGCVAGSPVWRSEIIPMMKKMDLNAVIFDIKDYSGYVSYKMPQIPEVAASGVDDKACIRNLEEVLREFHMNGIYVIGRITVFQDPVFATTHPDLALKNTFTGSVWEDNKGLEWLDPASESVWLYIEAMAKDALRRGFDEINFDYIRFPSDGQLTSISYPFYNSVEPKYSVMNRFFVHLRESLREEIISADLFGLSVSAFDDLGIGQIIETAFPNFDYIAPMIYPSHFAPGYKGFLNPAAEPYKVVLYAMQDASKRRENFVQMNPGIKVAQFRPWLQSFNLGEVYDRTKIDAQVKGVEDAFIASNSALNGWMFWDPSNIYTGLLKL